MYVMMKCCSLSLVWLLVKSFLDDSFSIFELILQLSPLYISDRLFCSCVKRPHADAKFLSSLSSFHQVYRLPSLFPLSSFVGGPPVGQQQLSTKSHFPQARILNHVTS